MNIKKLIHNKHFWIGVIVLVCTLVAIIGYYEYYSYYPSTEDAFVKAYIVPMSTNISNKIENVYVTNNEYVKNGTLLFTIYKKPYEIAVNKAKADLLQAKQNVKLAVINAHLAEISVREIKAKYLLAEQTYKRLTFLNKRKIISDQKEDEAISNYKVCREQFISAVSVLRQKKQKIEVAKTTIKEASIELNNANLNLSYTKIYAPANGYVSDWHLAPGEYVSKGEKLFAFIDSDQWWVRANFKETDIKRIKPGQKVSIYIDMYGRTIKGKVQSIGFGSGVTYSLIPSENSTGNWVKVTQRFPVKILVSNKNLNCPLRVGASVGVTINTTA